MNSPSATLVTVVRNSFHMCVCAAYTSRAYYLRVCLFKEISVMADLFAVAG